MSSDGDPPTAAQKLSTFIIYNSNEGRGEGRGGVAISVRSEQSQVVALWDKKSYS